MPDQSTKQTLERSCSKIVAGLLERQDSVLRELDVLNDRVETAIKSITEARQSQAVAKDGQTESGVKLENQPVDYMAEKAA